MNIEEKDMYQAIRNCKGRLTDFHVADNNRMACGMGALDWGKIIGTLKEIGYDGALTVEFVAPVDRTPANPYPNAIEKGPVEPHRRRAEVHRGPRQQHALGRVLHLARRRDDQDAAEVHVSSRRLRTIASPFRALIGTLDTKGPEIAYVRDRLQALGLATIVADSGILGEPLDIVPDVSRAEVARLGGKTIEALRQAGSRGEAVHGMLLGLQRLALNLFRDGRLDGVLCLGGAEGAVLGASAMMCAAHRHPEDHRHADRLRAAALRAAGRHARRDGRALGRRHPRAEPDQPRRSSTTSPRRWPACCATAHRLHGDDGRPRVAITMLGNTTKAVMTIRDALARQGLDSVIFHSNGVGGPAMEELAADGLFVGVIDFTTDELADELVGGFHVGGPERLRRIGRLGLPQIVVPGCIDFTVHGRPEEVPSRLQGRPVYTHNPEFTLVRTLPDEMAQLGRIFAERLNEATGPIEIMVPTAGPLDPQRAGRRVLGPGRRRRLPGVAAPHLRAGHPDLDPSAPHQRDRVRPRRGRAVRRASLDRKERST